MNDQPLDSGVSVNLAQDGETQPSATPSTAEENPLHKIFIGPNGLRALWRLLMYAAMVWALGFAVNHGLHAAGVKLSVLGGQTSPRFIIVTRILNFLLLFIPAFIMAKIEHRPVGVYGLPARGAFGKRFWEGIVWGFGSLSLLLLMLRLSGAFYFGSVALSLQSALQYAAIWGLAFLLVAFFEEYMFRGYVQYTLTTAMGFWPAAVLLSFLFALAHKANPGETWLGLVDVFLAGIVLAAMLIRTGNLWLPIGFHLGWDWAESYFYGVADSGMQATGALLHPTVPAARAWWLTGGSVGPEGSIFSCVTEILLIIFILWRFRENRYPSQQQPALITAA